MTDFEFGPYFNRHIKFRLSNGQELSGLLFFRLDQDYAKDPDTIYQFVQTQDLIEWNKADDDEKQKLQGEINIGDIVWAEHI